MSGVYFIKKKPEPVPREECCNFLVYGDLATKAIDQLACLVDDVFVPLLSNEENYDDWPEIVAQDVQKQVHNLKSTVYQVKGQVNGETILAMPVGVDKIVKVAAELQETKKCTIDLYLKGAIEGVVIKWVIQVNDVYSETPSNAFNGGQNPLPNVGKMMQLIDSPLINTFPTKTIFSPHYLCVELAFWNNRLRNFTQIYKQLRNERIRSMALILEATDSAYFPCFSTMFKNVVTGKSSRNQIFIEPR